MKKLITASVLVAFMGAVAFASLEGRYANSKKANTKDKKEQKQKEVKKKKEHKHACPFSRL
jgi:hypothetical protein